MGRRVNNKEYLQRYRETINGCDKKCKACILYENMCTHEYLKQWELWNKKKHQEFGRLVKIE